MSPCRRHRQAGARSTVSGHWRDRGATLQRWRRRRSSTGHRSRCRRRRRCGRRGCGSRGCRRGRRGRGRRLGGPGDTAIGGHGAVLTMPRPTIPTALAVIIIRCVQTLAAVPTWVRRTMVPVDLSTR